MVLTGPIYLNADDVVVGRRDRIDDAIQSGPAQTDRRRSDMAMLRFSAVRELCVVD